jgi:P27 family predicted phage terminase small subunit
MPRPRKTNELHRIQGTYREDRHGKRGLEVPVEVPSCPAWLSKPAKAEWRRITRELEAAGRISQLDRALLTAYCEAFAELEGLSAEIAKVSSPAEAIRLGLVGAKNNAAKRLVTVGRQLGLSPVSRLSLPAGQKQGPESTKSRFFDQLLGN